MLRSLQLLRVAIWGDKSEWREMQREMLEQIER